MPRTIRAISSSAGSMTSWARLERLLEAASTTPTATMTSSTRSLTRTLPLHRPTRKIAPASTTDFLQFIEFISISLPMLSSALYNALALPVRYAFRWVPQSQLSSTVLKCCRTAFWGFYSSSLGRASAFVSREREREGGGGEAGEEKSKDERVAAAFSYDSRAKDRQMQRRGVVSQSSSAFRSPFPSTIYPLELASFLPPRPSSLHQIWPLRFTSPARWSLAGLCE